MSSATVLSQYPLSRDFTQDVIGILGGDCRFLTLGELRNGTFFQMLSRLRRIGPGRLAIGLEDPTSAGALPVLKLLAAVSNARELSIIHFDRSVARFGRLGQVSGFFDFALASASALGAVAKSSSKLRELGRTPRMPAAGLGRGKRVAYVNTNLWFGQKAGGSVGHISGVANGLLDHGYELDYLSVGGRLLIRDQARHVELKPPRVFGLPFEANLFLFDYGFEAQAIKYIDPAATSFLYQRLSIGNYTGVRLSRRLNIPLVVEYNGSEVWVAEKWGRGLRFPAPSQAAEDATLRHAHLVVTISDVLRDELVERGIPPDRIVSYPNCIDPETFDPARFSQTQLADLRRAHEIPAEACVATFVGTFGAWHGAEIFAEAIRILATTRAAELRENRLMFWFVGDGVRMPEVRRILDHPACAEVVRFAGLVPQASAPQYLAASDILVSPHVPNVDGTRFFGSPTKLFEYLAMGKAIVASDLDQIGEVLQRSLRWPNHSPEVANQELAVLLPPGDAAALADGLIFLAKNPETREQLGRYARAEALSKYTWRQHVAAILEGVGAVTQ